MEGKQEPSAQWPELGSGAHIPFPSVLMPWRALAKAWPNGYSRVTGGMWLGLQRSGVEGSSEGPVATMPTAWHCQTQSGVGFWLHILPSRELFCVSPWAGFGCLWPTMLSGAVLSPVGACPLLGCEPCLYTSPGSCAPTVTNTQPAVLNPINSRWLKSHLGKRNKQCVKWNEAHLQTKATENAGVRLPYLERGFWQWTGPKMAFLQP